MTSLNTQTLGFLDREIYQLVFIIVWSVGKHGPTKELVERLRPMLIKYNVSAYFCGHDHDVQHIHESNSTVEYFLSGAGHETSGSDDNSVWRVPINNY